MFSQALLQRIADHFEQKMRSLGRLGQQLECQTQACAPDTAVMLKYLFASMPLPDLLNCPFATILDYASHAVFLQQNSPWTDRIPEELFLQEVLFHRINNEAIEPCRSLFHAQVAGLLAGKDMAAAALAINEWCASQVTYQASDERTASPVAIWKNGIGRCGEESVFTVSVLRSVGLPARQVYVPRWSHCDDNHAWVEVWCDDQWHFLGACEPEVVLDRGWFTHAAARAMLVHSRRFGPPGLVSEPAGMIGREGQVVFSNQLDRYAPVREITVHVTLADGQPAARATVEFCILNYAAFIPVATLTADANGQVRFRTGSGSLYLNAWLDPISPPGHPAMAAGTGIRWGSQLIDTSADTRVCLQLADQDLALNTCQQDSWTAFDFIAPGDSPAQALELNEAQKSASRDLLARTTACRNERAQSMAAARDSALAGLDPRLADNQPFLAILQKARANWPEIMKLAATCLDDASARLWLELLALLNEKDCRDVRAELLLDAVRSAARWQNQKGVPTAVFSQYLLNPRIHLEPITAWRDSIATFFSEELKQDFRDNPRNIWTYICEHFTLDPEKQLAGLTVTPEAVLQHGLGDPMSRKILFVAICRTLGIPARLSPVDLSAEYYQDGTFHLADRPDERGELILDGAENWPDAFWVDHQNWSIARYEAGTFQELDLRGCQWHGGKMTIQLQAGDYRVLTTQRLPNGNSLGLMKFIRIDRQKSLRQTLQARPVMLQNLLSQVNLPNMTFRAVSPAGTELRLSGISGSRTTLLVWLAADQEPCAHILNELHENASWFRNLDCQICLLAQDAADFRSPSVARVCAELPAILCLEDTLEDRLPALGRRVYLDTERLPVILVVRPGPVAVYATSGYNVGTAELLVRIVQGLSHEPGGA